MFIAWYQASRLWVCYLRLPWMSVLPWCACPVCLRPGAESAIAAARQRCVCGGGQDPDGYLGSMIWDTHEHLDQEREVRAHPPVNARVGARARGGEVLGVINA